MPTAREHPQSLLTGDALTVFRVGVDVTSVADVDESWQKFGARYTDRVFTERELADTLGTSQAAGLAARFAAKEATIKALAPQDDDPLPWRSIGVVRRPSGACELHLTGRAREMAEQAGLDRWSLSMSHEGPVAVAVVVAAGDPPHLPPPSLPTPAGDPRWTK